MRMLMILLPMIFLSLGASSCGSVQRKIVCAQVNDNQMKPLASGEISFQFNRCRARCLDPNTWQALPIKECKKDWPECEECEVDIAKKPDRKCESYCSELARNYPLVKCEGLAGFFVEDIATEIRPKVTALNRIKKDYCD